MLKDNVLVEKKRFFCGTDEIRSPWAKENIVPISVNWERTNDTEHAFRFFQILLK
jgi:hypothetical protein